MNATQDLYREAGVSIDAGTKVVELIKDDVASTHTGPVLTGIGSFGALYDLKEIFNNYDEPILVQSIDGVGTKLSVAKMMQRFDTVGEDIVNHSCNDILAMGAKPLTFLDYVAHDKLDPKLMADIVSGMSKACRENDLALIGGETAEMPGTYQAGEHDIVGSITGVVERNKIITGDKIQTGDILLGLPSNGLHTNGYSLVRKVLFDQAGFDVNDVVAELNSIKTLGEHLLEPHLNYSKPIHEVLDQGFEINGIVHVTGGGFTENIPRILPQGLSAKINRGSWPVLNIFDLIQERGNVNDEEMYRVFNMGIGLIAIVNPQAKIDIETILSKFSEVYVIGEVIESNKGVIL